MASIKVFARLKPCLSKNGSIRLEDQTLFICQQAGQKSSENSNVVDNRHKTQSLRFGFAHIFNVDSPQNSVYEIVAKDIVRAFLEGYNSTIFAYGQTGSGKTFTIHGSDGSGNCGNRSENEGLIPRCLSSVLKEVHIGQNKMFNVQVSFLGIYEETAYDLLGTLLYKGQNGKDLPKVLVTLGAGGSCHLHGLSAHLVNSEEDALKLYHLGVANRRTTQIPSNETLSRSHTIFTITLRQQKTGSDIIMRSKLHLVDLAGSERVWKSRVHEHECLSEAKFVNMSLHHLESVIIALQRFSVGNQSNKIQTEKSLCRCASAVVSSPSSCLECVSLPSTNIRHMSASISELRQTNPAAMLTLDHDVPYVPYRNSLLTMVLQDSLGGNCNTAMIATLALEDENLHETISTCRFAQRVARIVNKPVCNEEVDKNAVIKRLQTKLGKLHLELATFKATENESQLIYDDRNERFVDEQACANVMDCFLVGRIKDPVTHGINTPRKFRASLRYLRHMILERQSAVQALRPGDEVLESTDDQDSGVRTNSEPTSPLTSEGESDGILASHFGVSSTAADTAHRSRLTQDRGILLTSRYDQSAPSLDQPIPAHFKIPQPPGPARSEASTQTEVLTTFVGSSRKKSNLPANVVVDGLERGEPETVSGKDFIVWEKQLQKEALLNKNKVLASRLADQRARLVVMTRQGAFPEEVENEKIVELHLVKQQRKVEHELFTVIKQLAEQKDTNRHQLTHAKQLREQRREQRPGTDAAVRPSQTMTNHRSGLASQMAKELELKERSTRQKLLAGRECMKNYTFTASKPPCGIRSRLSFSASTDRRLRTGQTSYSSSYTSSSSVTLQEDEERVHGSKCSKSSNSSTIVFNKSGPRNVVTAAFSVKGKLELKLRNTNRRGTFDINRNCGLIEYIHSSHQSLYRKSTFLPRRSDGSSVTRGVRVQTTKEEERCPTTETVNKLCVTECSGSILDDKVSESSLQACTGDFAESAGGLVGENKLANSNTELQRENQSRCEKTGFQFLKDELAGCEVKELTHSRLFRSKRQQERVQKIRQYVHAAEVIQLSWRRYKRRKNQRSVIKY